MQLRGLEIISINKGSFVKGNRPKRHLKVVVFPEPFGPIKPKVSFSPCNLCFKFHLISDLNGSYTSFSLVDEDTISPVELDTIILLAIGVIKGCLASNCVCISALRSVLE